MDEMLPHIVVRVTQAVHQHLSPARSQTVVSNDERLNWIGAVSSENGELPCAGPRPVVVFSNSLIPIAELQAHQTRPNKQRRRRCRPCPISIRGSPAPPPSSTPRRPGP